MSTTTISIVIPAFNRLAPLKLTLRSAAAALRVLGEAGEILLVDDGSTPPLAEQLAEFDAGHPFQIIRQANAGSIVARQTGFAAARGEFVLFLDSDDLIHPEKLVRQIAAMRAANADISYSDMAEATVGDDTTPPIYSAGSHLKTVTDVVDLFLLVAPPPHGPIYRRTYLARALASPILPPERIVDPVGDTWLYFNLCVHPARLVKVDAPLTAIGPHEHGRFSSHWENLGFAALLVLERFARLCPATPEFDAARRQAGACAFCSWRRMPPDFSRAFQRRHLAVWRALPRAPLDRLGSPLFRKLARLLGPVNAGRLLRLRNSRYSAVRTLSPAQYAAFEQALANH